MSETPKLGQRVRFRDGEAILEGFVNGEPMALERYNPEPTHVPVYVHEGDRCIAVAIGNIEEVVEA